MRRFSLLPPVIKNLMIINLLFFIGTGVLFNTGLDLGRYLALYLPSSGFFMPHQLVTHMFMHADWGHIFSNLFMLWMFGYALENIWGAKRFLNYYIITGLGAAFLHFGAQYFELYYAIQDISAAGLELVRNEGYQVLLQNKNYTDPALAKVNLLMNRPTVGASGAVFGVLMAFGMIFKDQVVYLNFLFPIKAKYLVLAFGLLELYRGFANAGGNVAHFAHLGGMLFGFLILRYWKSKHGTYH